MKRWSSVRVEWDDACGGDIGWMGEDEIDHQPMRVVTVGLLYRKDKKGVTVVHSRGGDDVSGFTFIPTGNVVSVQELQPGSPSSKDRK